MVSPVYQVDQTLGVFETHTSPTARAGGLGEEPPVGELNGAVTAENLHGRLGNCSD